MLAISFVLNKGGVMKVSILILVLLAVTALSWDRVRWQERRVRVRRTAYCPCSICCGPHADGKTAVGRSAWTPGVAVDPSIIPLGSRLDIPGYPRNDGVWIPADDTGAAINGHHIDLRFDDHKEALDWARTNDEWATVRVWEKR